MILRLDTKLNKRNASERGSAMVQTVMMMNLAVFIALAVSVSLRPSLENTFYSAAYTSGGSIVAMTQNGPRYASNAEGGGTQQGTGLKTESNGTAGTHP